MQINEEETGKLPEKEFRIMIEKMIKNLDDKMKKMQDSVNRDLEELKNKPTETNNKITEIKNTLEIINSNVIPRVRVPKTERLRCPQQCKSMKRFYFQLELGL